MSPTDTFPFDFTDFWFAYLSEPNGLVNNEATKQNHINEMDENPKLINDGLFTTYKG